MPNNDWPFEDEPDTMVITLEPILHRKKPILYVSHDEDDGMWQLLDGSDISEEDARLISLEEAVVLDPSLRALADLPLGWCAWREDRDSKWNRQMND